MYIFSDSMNSNSVLRLSIQELLWQKCKGDQIYWSTTSHVTSFRSLGATRHGFLVMTWSKLKQEWSDSDLLTMSEVQMQHGKESQVLPTLAEALRTRRQPEALVIHLGDNGLVHCPAVELITNMGQDSSRIGTPLPKARLIWVNTLPRRVWRGAHNPEQYIKRGRKLTGKLVEL